MMVLSGCTKSAPEETREISDADEQPHFTYTGDYGPEYWSELDPSFTTCGTGKSQSPIDLTGATAQDVTNIEFNYQPSRIHIVNNGHSVQVNYDPGSYIEVDGQRYNLLQFHFHAPSEHEVDGKSFPMEMHLVHKNDAGQLAVIGVFLDNGAENAAFKPIWENLPAEEGSKKDIEARINAIDLLPVVQTTYRYSGSLTTPPCTEGVSWFVMTSPLELSGGQIAAFEQIYYGNNRPVQQLNSRTIVVDSTP